MQVSELFGKNYYIERDLVIYAQAKATTEVTPETVPAADTDDQAAGSTFHAA